MTRAFLDVLPVVNGKDQSGKWGKTPASRLVILLTISSVEV
jgi:hypothetical protein